jgi:hypothetical protein
MAAFEHFPNKVTAGGVINDLLIIDPNLELPG